LPNTSDFIVNTVDADATISVISESVCPADAGSANKDLRDKTA